MTYDPSRLVGAFLIGFAAVCAAFSQSSIAADEASLEEDLRAVIILAGYPCSKVGKITQTRTDDYQVSCIPDRQYRVRISEEEKVLVESLSDPSQKIATDDESHQDFMKRKLFSIVNLAGHHCASVLAYERRGPRDSLVTCDDQTIYRIYVTPEGRVNVDKQTLDK